MARASAPRLDGAGHGAGDDGAKALTPNQTARRRSVLDAARGLAEEGGYDAVQMRDVASRAGVALGTVYRYFSSKDQLLAAAFADWASNLEKRLGGSPLEGETPAERLSEFMHRATRPFERRRKLAAALVTSLASPDPHAADEQQAIASWMTRMVADAVVGLDADAERGVRDVLARVWYAVLLAWVNERIDTARMYEEIDTACHLLLDPRTAS